MNYLSRANALRGELIKDRRTLHQHPEVGSVLPWTVSYVQQRLEQIGYTTKAIHGGLTAIAGTPSKGKTILLRADMDALPILEESGEPFASTNGASHSCGHDCHMAMLLCAAKMLKEQEHQLRGGVKLVFQPDEEGLTGAAGMCSDGVLENPGVDAAVALHVIPTLSPAGVVASGVGEMAASSDIFRITLSGSGGHGAIPQKATDVVGAATLLSQALEHIRGHEIDPQTPFVLTVGSIQAGDAPNTLPERAVLSGTFRAFDASLRSFVLQRIRRLAEGISHGFCCESNFELLSATPPCVNARILTEQLMEYLSEVAPSVITVPRVMGSEDFAEFSQRVPSTYFMLGAGGIPGCQQAYAQHDPRVRFHEDALPYGAAYLAGFAQWWLKQQQQEATK